ncbi:MAG: Y-family DNA polymerase [Candidatus Saccharimonadales bacterium]
MYALIDCNNFFVSCERLFRPELTTKPVVVLSNNDGCFISRSQEAKDIGLPMGAPRFKYESLIKLHQVTMFSANFELYGNVSERIVTILREVTPLIEVYSIDEAFMDLSELQIEDYDAWAQEVRQRITREVGIPVSIGVAPTKTLAKVASTYAKKRRGVYAVIDEVTRTEMLSALPVEDIWGVGWRTAPKLQNVGISTAMQLISMSDGWVRQQFNIVGQKMIDELRGVARIPFGDKHEQRKQIMRSRSFGHKVRAYHVLESAIASFAAQTAVKLRAQDSVARHIVVFLSANRHTKDQPRVYLSTLVVLPEASADTARIVTAALQGLEDIYDDQFAYQKGGVILHDIVDRKDWQLSMLSSENKRDQRTELMASMDVLNSKYGGIIYHAAEREKKNTWHSKQELRSPRYTTSWTDLPKL